MNAAGEWPQGAIEPDLTDLNDTGRVCAMLVSWWKSSFMVLPGHNVVNAVHWTMW